MSQLEQKARATLEPLIFGTAKVGELSRSSRRLLARWAAKTAYALDAAVQEPKVPREHFRELYEYSNRLPQRVAVFAHEHEPDRDWYYCIGRWWKHIPLLPDAQEKVQQQSYKIVIQLRHLLLAVAFWPLAGWNYAVEKGELVTVWPPTLQPKHYVHPDPMSSTTSEDKCLRYCTSISIYPTRRAEGAHRGR